MYQVVPSRNFSAHLLQEFPKHVAVMELRDVVWSDLGKPERIAETLRHIGREPVFWSGAPCVTLQQQATEQPEVLSQGTDN
jgi:hypothetical protein